LKNKYRVVLFFKLKNMLEVDDVGKAVVCPSCGRQGVVEVLKVRGRREGQLYSYLAVRHVEHSKVKRCVIRRLSPEEVEKHAEKQAMGVFQAEKHVFQVEKQGQELERYRSEIESLKAENESLRRENGELKVKVAELEKKLKACHDKLKAKQIFEESELQARKILGGL